MLSTWRANIGRLIRDDAGILAPDDLDFAIGEAVKRYSRAKPRVVVADLVAEEGGPLYDFPLPADYSEGVSQLREVEYPIGRRQRVLVDRLDWIPYRSPSGLGLRMLADTPSLGEAIRVTYTALHSVDEDGTSVPSADHDVITLVGASLACESLASHYSSAGDATVMADSVQHSSKASEYAARARRFMVMANELIPLPEQGAVPAAGGVTSWGDHAGFLTHPRR